MGEAATCNSGYTAFCDGGEDPAGGCSNPVFRCVPNSCATGVPMYSRNFEKEEDNLEKFEFDEMFSFENG